MNRKPTTAALAFGARLNVMALGIVLAAIVGVRAHAETCLSPFVKRLDRPEKYLYLWCVDADAKDTRNHFTNVASLAAFVTARQAA